jgi:rod shape determining protein RodA
MQVKILDRFNFAVLISALGLIIIGLLAIYSATNSNPQVSGNFYKQLIASGIGVIVVLIITFLPPRYILLSSYVLYGINILLLLLVLIIGRKILGHTSWFSIGGFGIQPSEFAKVTTVLALASYISKRQDEIDISNPREFFTAVFIGLLPLSLIILQPDIGTSFVFISFLIPVLYWGGMSNFMIFVIIAPVLTAICAFLGTYYFIAAFIIISITLFFFKKNILLSTLVLTAVIVAGLSVHLVYEKMQPYQQRRIDALFNPESDALGSGYNIIQSKIAIGSGGMWGKGFLQGTQTQLKYIPEQWTDFIFCMIGEEFGFAGSVVVVVLFLILIWQTFYVAYICKNRFLSICCIGFGSIILIHVFFNIGMTIGITPVVGIPLPFMSYGVSFLFSNLVMLGLILNAYRNRKEYT